MKELVSIRPLVQKAKDELRALAASENRLRETHDDILRRAWTLGGYLCELKENVGRGSWLIWLPENLPELGGTDRARQANAARCMRFTGTIRLVAGKTAISPPIRNVNFYGITCL